MRATANVEAGEDPGPTASLQRDDCTWVSGSEVRQVWGKKNVEKEEDRRRRSAWGVGLPFGLPSACAVCIYRNAKCTKYLAATN